MPNILRNFRVDPNLWEIAKNKSSDDERSLTSVITAALEAYVAEEDDGDEVLPLTAAAKGPTAAIIGHGSMLLDSESPTIQEAVQQAKELLATGAVAVSIGADMDPDSMPDKETLDKLLEDEDYEGLEKLLANVPWRIRHVAIEDTAAFADARMTLSEDGSIDGPVTFEGIWTGDMRYFAVGSLQWESALPVTLKLGHDGPVIGSLHSFERVDGEVTAGRPATVQEEAVVAAAGLGHLSYPARYFNEQNLTEATPLTISAPDANGLRHIYGHVAPHGVCHRSDMAPCFTYPGDVDSTHKGFHTGAAIRLDNGTSLRVGALTLGGSHINPALARQGVSASEVNAHRDNANKVFAMVRAYDDAFGLAVSGVVMLDVTPADIMRAQSCGPSVELWPSGAGRTLVGAHLVPTPAWPVAASMGSSIELAGSDSVVVEQSSFDFNAMAQSLARIEAALSFLALDAMTDVPEPE